MRRRVATGAAILLAGFSAGLAQATDQPIKLAEFVVTPSRFGVADGERLSAAASLTSTELETLPQIGDDLYRSIARLPGLAADDYTAKFWVRGAPNGELLARLDGVDLVEPFHLKDIDGALSIVDPATIGRLDLATGGFGAEAGDRLAAVLTMETKNVTAPHTSLGLSLTGVGGNNQGVFAQTKGRWLAAVRRGYPDVALKVAHRDDEVYPRYYDAMAKFEYQLAPEQTVSFHVLHAGDTLRFHKSGDPDLSSNYNSDYAWTRWRGVGPGGLTGEAVLSWARLTWQRDGAGQKDGYPFSLHDHRRFDVGALRNEWTAPLGERALLRGGIEGKLGSAQYDYALSHQFAGVSSGRQIVITDAVNSRLRPDGGSLGAFAALRLQPLASLVVEPGARFDRHDYTHDSEWNPRLNAALTLGRAVVRAAWGLYSQSQGLHEVAVADGETGFHRAERAEHRVLGIERPIARGVSLRIEGYERITSHVRPHWQNLDNPYELFPEAESDRVLIAPSEARARGAEMLVAGRPSAQWAWNVSYALARTEEKVAGGWIPRARDQRHTVYTDVTYAPSRRWQFSAAWQFHTGWPTTDVLYSLSPLTNGRRLLVSANGPIYGLRLADYHRLDFRATRRFATHHGEVRTFVDVFNVYDRTNVIGYNHHVTVSGTSVTDARKPREQLPFLPSVGISWEL